MLDLINKAIISAYSKHVTDPDSDEETNAKNLLIKQKSEETSTALMADGTLIANLIKKMEGKYGPDSEASRLFNVFPYIRLAIVDLYTLNYYIAGEQNQTRLKFLLRSIALVIFELSEDIHHILGKEFRHSLRIFSNQADILLELDKVGKEYKKFQKQHLAELKEIRNITIAHRDRSSFRQIEILDKLDLIKHGIISWMVIGWFEDFKRIEQLILQGLVANRTAKEHPTPNPAQAGENTP